MAISVFIVDDHYMVIEGIRSLLQNETGIEWAGHAMTAASCLAFLKQQQPDVILMDINLPALDGLGATRRIREIEALREVPVVAITAFGTEGFQRAAYDAGVSGYLTKPFDFDRMHQLIARLLSTGESGNLTNNPLG